MAKTAIRIKLVFIVIFPPLVSVSEIRFCRIRSTVFARVTAMQSQHLGGALAARCAQDCVTRGFMLGIPSYRKTCRQQICRSPEWPILFHRDYSRCAVAFLICSEGQPFVGVS